MSLCLSSSYLNHPAYKQNFCVVLIVLSAACLILVLPYFFPIFQ